MKNILEFFYQIVLNDEINQQGYFFYNNNLFELKEYKRSQEEIKGLVILNNYMLINNIKINRIILNINNEPLSFYNNKYYVLLKIDYRNVYNNCYNSYRSPNIKELDSLKRNNWSLLWSVKVDYIEYQVSHLIHKYPILYKTVNYYIGLSENAIMAFNMLNVHEELYISHRRLNDVFDPTELVIDYKVRDISEYIKNTFFYKEDSYDEIINYIRTLRLEKMDYMLLYIRLLFPSYYFDMYYEILNGRPEEDILLITSKALLYEKMLKDVYNIFKTYVNIINISWL